MWYGCANQARLASGATRGGRSPVRCPTACHDRPRPPGSRRAGRWRRVSGARFQQFTHLACQIVGAEGLFDKRGAWVENAVIHGGVFCVSGHIKNCQPVADRGNLRHQFASLHSGHDHVG